MHSFILSCKCGLEEGIESEVVSAWPGSYIASVGQLLKLLMSSYFKQ